MKNHPTTCKCERCPGRSRGGRHPQLCQCRGCISQKTSNWARYFADKVAQSYDALDSQPTKSKPILVKAHWRRSPNFLRKDPGLRRALLGDETE